MRISPTKTAFLTGIVLILATQVSAVQSFPRKSPPKEAISACYGKRTGSSCTIQSPKGMINGICKPHQQARICVPTSNRQAPPKTDYPPRDTNRATTILPRAARSLVPDTGQNNCYGDRKRIACPQKGSPYYGQDAQYITNPPSYKDNGDGTVTDLVTGLTWQKTPNTKKLKQEEAQAYADSLSLAGYTDWRLPTIKELFSIVDFNGNMKTKTPYIDTSYFDFQYPQANSSGSPGSRYMDAQYASSNYYVGTTMNKDISVFGFNFADGRIKSYPLKLPKYVRCVRGPVYGVNNFVDNGDGTITDKATGLMWMKTDSQKTMNWQQALSYAENLSYAGHTDWRLPNVKELQSIVDYSKSPDARNHSQRGAAIDDIFELSNAESWFWSSTTHLETEFAYYVSFGQAFSAKRLNNGQKMNAHGAGAVRSDPKSGNPAQWKNGLGPQSDEIRIYNYVRCVRNAK